MKPSRQDKEPVGLGASVSLAVVGVIVAGLGLLTMRQAFPPLPKPETPVVLVHADQPLVNADYRAPSEPQVRALELTADPTARTAPSRRKAARSHGLREHARVAARPEAVLKPVKATPAPAALPAAAAQKIAAASSSASDVKLCKAPAPNEVVAKALQPGLILRYDPTAKASALDIPPPSPPAEQERRLKLSALLADILEN